MRHSMKNSIDIIIPWVDSEDRNWQRKKDIALEQNGIYTSTEMNGTERYQDYGTLKFVFRSIEVNMPWVNKVILVTDNQQPEWLNNAYDKLQVVDHKEFIHGKLPTFNSNSIMTNLHHIESLEEHFILFNDDLLAWSPMDEKDFFVDGVPVDSLIESGTVPFVNDFFHVSGNAVALANKNFKKYKVMRTNFFKFFNYKYGIDLFRTILSLPYKGFVGFQNPHFALGYTKSEFERFERLEKEKLEVTWSHDFRTLTDLNEWAIRYDRNLRGEFVPGKLNGKYLTLSSFKKEVTIPARTRILVVNDDGERDKNVLDNVQNFLNAKFPSKSNFEL